MKMGSTIFPVLMLASVTGLANAESVHKEVTFEYQPDTKSAAAPAENTKKGPLAFGKPGQDWITIGTGISDDFSSNIGYDLHAAWSTFLIDDVEFSLELATWYYNQEGPNAFGVNPQFVFRWHFYKSDDRKWTIFAEAGIGLLFTSDNVPDGGTSFDFTPRVGAGFTRELTDSGLRLQVGVRWAHISNARINGDSRNPSRDSAMLFAGLMFPF